MTLAVLALVGAVASYGVATFLLADGALGGVSAATRSRVWWAGNGFQALGFVGAFLARAHLPLLVVQPATTASVAIAAVLGAALGRWRLSRRDLFGLTLVMAGIAALATVAAPGPANRPEVVVMVPLVVLLLACGAVAVRWLRVAVPLGRPALLMGALSGVAFGASAVGSRTIAADPWERAHSTAGVLALVLLVAGSLVGQALLTASLSGGAMAGPTTAMHVVETVGPAAVGLLVLGDTVVAGRQGLALTALAAALAGSLLLAGHGRPAGGGRQ